MKDVIVELKKIYASYMYTTGNGKKREDASASPKRKRSNPEPLPLASSKGEAVSSGRTVQDPARIVTY